MTLDRKDEIPPDCAIAHYWAIQAGGAVSPGAGAILLGVCAGARTTTAALGMITEAAKSQVPGLGYTVTYAVGNTLLTISGMLLILLLA